MLNIADRLVSKTWRRASRLYLDHRHSVREGLRILHVLPEQFTTLKKNGGWCWYQDERVIVDSGRLLFGTVAGTTRDEHDAGDIAVTAYDMEAEQSTSVTLHAKFESDDHATPSLLKLPDGRYLVAYSTHGQDCQFRYRISERPGQIDAWTKEQTLEIPGSAVTYTNLHALSEPNGGEGHIYNFSRAKNNNPNLVCSDDDGESWTWKGQLLDWSDRPYLKYASNGQDVIHLVTTDGHPRVFDNSIYHGYLQGGVLYDSFGRAVQDLSEGPLKQKALTEVFAGDAHNVAWTIDLHLEPSGHPIIGFSVQKDGASFKNNPAEGPAWDHRYYYARFDGRVWHTHEMAYAGSSLYADEADYTGLLAIDPNQPNVVYVSADVHPQTGLPNVSEADGKRHYEIFKGVTNDGGDSWTWSSVTKNSTQDHLHPVIPIWEGDRRAVLWQRGDYRTYKDYDTDIVGVIRER